MRVQDIFQRGLARLHRYRQTLRFGQSVDLSDGDSLLISFPKCGRTWLRMLLGKAISLHYGAGELGEALELTPLTRRLAHIPTIVVDHANDPHRKTPGELPRSLEAICHKRVVFLTRDIRDTLVSMYYHNKCREPGNFVPIEAVADLPTFARYPTGSLATIIEFYNIWHEQRRHFRELRVVSYEELQNDTFGTLRSLCRFLQLDCITDAELCEAIEASSFDKMREIEIGNSANNARLAPLNGIHQEALKTRSGKVGGFKKEFDKATLDYVDREITDKLRADFPFLCGAESASRRKVA